MTEPQEKESQKRIDSIIALIMEEARTLKGIPISDAIHVVVERVRARTREIMRTMEE